MNKLSKFFDKDSVFPSLIIVIVGGLISVIIASILQSGWPDGLLINLEYPYVLHNDGWAATLQRLIEGWEFNNDRQGYPFGSSTYDYPKPDYGTHVLTKLLAYSFGGWVPALNMYFLLGFFLTFASSYLVSRMLSLSIASSILVAFLFTFIPFHFLRNHHLNFTFYFVIPIYWFIAINFNSVSFMKGFKGGGYLKKFLIMLGIFSLSLFGIYFTFYGIIVITIGFIASLYKDASLYKVKVFFLTVSLIVFGTFIQVSPHLYNNLVNGKNDSVAKRSAMESEVYGFKLMQLIIPRQNHRVSKLAHINSSYSGSTPLVNENMTSSLGIFGVFGFIFAFFRIFSSLSGKNNGPSSTSLISLIVLILFLIGTIGGLGSVFSHLISPMLRGWNRVSIYIGFGTLVIFFMYFDSYVRSKVSKKILVLITALIFVIGMLDSTIPPCKSCIQAQNSEFESERKFIEDIESILPTNSAIYQLPYFPFPETAPMHNLMDYRHGNAFIHSKDLRWSYGGMKGREGDRFFKFLSKESLSKQFEVISRLGFQGVYVDLNGYPDKSKLEDVSKALGFSPTLTRDDSPVVFFKLNNSNNNIDLIGKSVEEIMDIANYHVDENGVQFSYDAVLEDGIDFKLKGLPSFLKKITGLSGPEDWGRWSDRNLADDVTIEMVEPLPKEFELVVQLIPFTPNVNKIIDIHIGDLIFPVTLLEGKNEYKLKITLDSNTYHKIIFIIHNSKTPKSLGMNVDTRDIGVGFVGLKINK
jgi:phosphoglycerol transferase